MVSNMTIPSGPLKRWAVEQLSCSALMIHPSITDKMKHVYCVYNPPSKSTRLGLIAKSAEDGAEAAAKADVVCCFSWGKVVVIVECQLTICAHCLRLCASSLVAFQTAFQTSIWHFIKPQFEFKIDPCDNSWTYATVDCSLCLTTTMTTTTVE